MKIYYPHELELMSKYPLESKDLFGRRYYMDFIPAEGQILVPHIQNSSPNFDTDSFSAWKIVQVASADKVPKERSERIAKSMNASKYYCSLVVKEISLDERKAIYKTLLAQKEAEEQEVIDEEAYELAASTP